MVRLVRFILIKILAYKDGVLKDRDDITLPLVMLLCFVVVNDPYKAEYLENS